MSRGRHAAPRFHARRRLERHRDLRRAELGRGHRTRLEFAPGAGAPLAQSGRRPRHHGHPRTARHLALHHQGHHLQSRPLQHKRHVAQRQPVQPVRACGHREGPCDERQAALLRRRAHADVRAPRCGRQVRRRLGLAGRVQPFANGSGGAAHERVRFRHREPRPELGRRERGGYRAHQRRHRRDLRGGARRPRRHSGAVLQLLRRQLHDLRGAAGSHQSLRRPLDVRRGGVAHGFHQYANPVRGVGARRIVRPARRQVGAGGGLRLPPRRTGHAVRIPRHRRLLQRRLLPARKPGRGGGVQHEDRPRQPRLLRRSHRAAGGAGQRAGGRPAFQPHVLGAARQLLERGSGISGIRIWGRRHG